MAASNVGNSDASTPSSSMSQQSSPTDTTTLMTNGSSESAPRCEVHRWVFSSPKSMFMPGAQRYHSPRIYHTRPRSPNSRSPPLLTRSLSENAGMNSYWRSDSRLSDGPPASTSFTMAEQGRSPSNESFQEHQRYQLPSAARPDSRNFRASLTSQNGSTGHFRTASILSDVRPPPILSRSSTRRSFGREWTRSHWEKVRDLEQESERARRCSKLSSGFAPLMVFGGLVFVCIGVSAATNTGADQERLRKLSAAPMAMGIFMLALGIFLIASWFGCRGRAKGLEQRLLHGSRRNSIDDNLVQTLIAKLTANDSANHRQAPSPTLPGVTLDGVDVLKPQPDKEVRRDVEQAQCTADTSACCSHCGASNTTAAHVVLETSI